jgi:hypothetical protein
MRLSSIILAAVTAGSVVPVARADSQKSRLQPGIHVLYLDDMKIETIHVPKSGTVLSFPTKPTKVVLGDSESFAIQYVTHDLVFPTLTSPERKVSLLRFSKKIYLIILEA